MNGFAPCGSVSDGLTRLQCKQYANVADLWWLTPNDNLTRRRPTYTRLVLFSNSYNNMLNSPPAALRMEK